MLPSRLHLVEGGGQPRWPWTMVPEQKGRKSPNSHLANERGDPRVTQSSGTTEVRKRNAWLERNVPRETHYKTDTSGRNGVE